MAQIVKQQTSSSATTPASGSTTLFVDSADGLFKKKDDTGTVTPIEQAAGTVTSVFGRSGAVVAASGDYSALQITNTPAGSITSVTVQAAINELDSEKAPLTHVGSNGVLQHAVADGSSAGFLSPSDFTKLAGIAAGATANFANSYLLDRANHTGTQLASTISDFASAAQTQISLVKGQPSGIASLDGSTLVPIGQLPTAILYDRANQTGTQLASTISDFSSAADARISVQKGAANGLATLDASSKIPLAQIPSSITGALNYQGTWDASSNSPALSSGVGVKGYYYVVDVAGSTNLDGVSSWLVGDWAVFNGAVWEKIDNQNKVSSVNGQTGTVVLTTTNISEGSNLYFTTGRAQTAVVQNALSPASTVLAPSVDSVNTALASRDADIALKVAKAGDTMTGTLNLPRIVITASDGTGNSNYIRQSVDPSTPAQGFKLFANNSGKFSWKGENGFTRVFDGTSNTADRTYTLPNQSGGLLIDSTTTTGDMLYRNSGGLITRLPIGTDQQLLRSIGGIPVWADENLGQDFGDGSNGNVTISGSLTLSQIVYYDTLTIQAGAAITTNGYPIYCKTLDLTAATTAGAFKWNGNPGTGNQINAAGGVGGAALGANVLGGSIVGGAGGAGGAVATAGTIAAAPTNATPANGGAGGAGGAGGTGNGAAGAVSRAGATATNNVAYGRFETQFTRGATLVVGGASGAGGSGGGGDTVTNTGRGGGGGGSGGGVIAIYADSIITSVSTVAGLIQCNGGAGGGNTTTVAGGGGAGGGGGGGAGGFVYIAYNYKTGPTITDLVQCNGGNGGAGGNSVTSGNAGTGGTGGSGGRIMIYNAAATTGMHVVGSSGGAGGAPSGTTGGTGGSAGTCTASL